MLEAALVGLQHRREEIDVKVAELRELIAKLSSGDAGHAAGRRPGRRARVLSAAARARIAAAQKKRWEAFRKSKTQQGKAKATGSRKKAKPRRRTAAKRRVAAPAAPPAAASTANA